MDSCAQCKKSSPEVSLKQCANCNVTKYCSRDCQKADWKTHKKSCAKQNTADHSAEPSASPRQPGASSRQPGSSRQSAPINVHTLDPDAPSAASPPKGLDKPIDKPFTRLTQNTWLHDRSEKDVYRLLIDAYRLRAEDEYKFLGDAGEGSIYDGSSNSSKDFSRFLRKVERAGKGILPPWWNAEKKAACMGLGMSGNEWQDLRRAVEKVDIQEHYGDPKFPMQLRMFAESFYGNTPGGSDGGRMMAIMASME